MFFLIDLADAFVLTNGEALGIMGNTDWGYSFSEHPRSGWDAGRVFDDFGRAVAKLLLHSLPGCGWFIDMAVTGYQLEIGHSYSSSLKNVCCLWFEKSTQHVITGSRRHRRFAVLGCCSAPTAARRGPKFSFPRRRPPISAGRSG